MNRNLMFALLTMAVATVLALPGGFAKATETTTIIATHGTCSHSTCVLNSGDCYDGSICVLNSGNCDASTCIGNYYDYIRYTLA
jgi:hypothetical protein